MGQGLLTEGQLADGPDLRVRLQVLLDFRVERTGLDGDDLGGRVGVVGDGAAAVAAEPAPNAVAAAAFAFPLLQRALDGEFVLGDNGDEGVCRAGLTLAIVAMVVAGQQRGIDINSVGSGLAQAVSGESHCEGGLADVT